VIDFRDPEPPYVQLAGILRGQIERGELAPRRPVPSKRTLTQTYGIAGGTVDKALAVLRGEGLVKTVRGRGIYVTAPEERSRALVVIGADWSGHVRSGADSGCRHVTGVSVVAPPHRPVIINSVSLIETN